MIVPANQRHAYQYVRFYDMTDQDKIKEGNFESFDFAPAKAKLELKRNAHGVDTDYLPSKDELADEKDAAYVSGQENYKKHFYSRVISRYHATISWSPTQPYPSLIDEGSTHGTFLIHRDHGVKAMDVPALTEDDKRWEKLVAKTPTPLHDGDVIMLGKVVKNKDDFVPHKLFVEMYPHGKWRERRLERSMKTVLYNDSDDDDDDVVEVVPKLQQKAAKEKAEVKEKTEFKKKLTVILSDDESDTEDYEPIKPDVKKAIAVSIEAKEDDDAGEQSVIGVDSDEEIGPSDGENDEEGANYIDHESLEIFDSDEEVLESEEESEEDEEDEEEEGEIVMKTTSIVDAVVQRSQHEVEDDDDTAQKMDEDTPAVLDEAAMTEHVESNLDEILHLQEAVAAAITSALEQREEVLEDGASSSGSSSSSSSSSSSGESSETKITLSDGTNVTPVKLLQETTVIVEEEEDDDDDDDVAMNNVQEEPAVLDVTSIQVAASNKRSHDEVESAEGHDENVTVVAATNSASVLVTPAEKAVSAPVLSLPPQKKIKTFTAGLAAGLVAGVVGTFVGLSSLALSDSSLV